MRAAQLLRVAALVAVLLGAFAPIRGLALVAAAASDPSAVAVQCSPSDIRDGKHHPPKHVPQTACPALKLQVAPQIAAIAPTPDVPVPAGAGVRIGQARSSYRSRAPPLFHAQARAPPSLS